MDRKKLTIPVGGDESVSAILTLPADREKTPRTGVITAHGAGNDMENDLVVAFTEGVAAAGYPALRFNFPYKEKGLKAPDRQNKLEETWTAVCRHFQENPEVGVKRVIAAGKSMGGRVASQMIAEKRLPVDGMIFLGYPLHPADDQTRLRDAHLYRIALPMLFFAGTRDTLCNLTILQTVLRRLSAPWQLEIIEGGDHSFYVPKSMNLAKSDVFDRVAQTAIRWLKTTFPENNLTK